MHDVDIVDASVTLHPSVDIEPGASWTVCKTKSSPEAHRRSV